MVSLYQWITPHLPDYPYRHPLLPGRKFHPVGGRDCMGGQAPPPEPVRRSVWNAGRTPPPLDSSSDQRGVPRQYPLAQGRPDQIGGMM